MVQLITAVVKPHKLEDVKDALKGVGVTGMTVTQVSGFGRQGGKSETFRGSEYTIDFVPKVKIEVLVESDKVDPLIEALTTSARTGQIGDGKVWSFPVDRLVRVRTGEVDVEAV